MKIQARTKDGTTSLYGEREPADQDEITMVQCITQFVTVVGELYKERFGDLIPTPDSIGFPNKGDCTNPECSGRCENFFHISWNTKIGELIVSAEPAPTTPIFVNIRAEDKVRTIKVDSTDEFIVLLNGLRG